MNRKKDKRKKEWLLMVKHTQLFLYLVGALIDNMAQAEDRKSVLERHFDVYGEKKRGK